MKHTPPFDWICNVCGVLRASPEIHFIDLDICKGQFVKNNYQEINDELLEAAKACLNRLNGEKYHTDAELRPMLEKAIQKAEGK